MPVVSLMPEPLSTETIARMKRQHVNWPEDPDHCGHCCSCDDDPNEDSCFPCHVALLLAELERVKVVLASLFGTKIAGLESQLMSPGEWDTLKNRLVTEAHCHCGRDGMEPAHPSHDGTIGWSSRNQGWQESSRG